MRWRILLVLATKTKLEFNIYNLFPRDDVTVPTYAKTTDEPMDTKRARLLYQSRKRGIRENGLLLGTFAKKYLPDFNEVHPFCLDESTYRSEVTLSSRVLCRSSWCYTIG